MPFTTIKDLPPEVRALSVTKQRQWLAVFNDVIGKTHDEDKAFKAAWSAVRNAPRAQRPYDLPGLEFETLTPDEKTVWGRAFDLVMAQTQSEYRSIRAAWGAIVRFRRREDMPAPIRSVGVRRDGDMIIVDGWGMMFLPEAHGEGPDEFFSAMTALFADYYKDAPLWYEHGFEPDYGYHAIGRRHDLAIYGFGVWAEHTLDPAHPLIKRTLAEIERGELAYSSDSIAHYVEEGLNILNGNFRVWPLAGWSLTRQPAEPGLGPVTATELRAAASELTAAPSRHYNIDQAVVRVTAANTSLIVGTPQAADPDAQTVPEQPDGTNPEPSFIDNLGGSIMDPEVLAQLAEFLNVEATPEAVRAALEQLIASLAPEGEESAVETETVQALASALELAEDATPLDVVTALQEIISVLQPPATEDEPVPARSLDVGALRNARTLIDQHEIDEHATPPYVVRAPGRSTPAARTTTPARADDTEPGYVNAPEQPVATAEPIRHRRRGLFPARPGLRGVDSPRFNRGAAPPGIIDAIYVATGRRAPSMPNVPLAKARRHIESMQRQSQAMRDVASDDGPRGGFVLARGISDTILDPLVAETVVMQAGAQVFPMDGIDTLQIPKSTAIPEAYWADEWQTSEGDTPEWGTATLRLKALRCPVRLPNKWLRNLVPGAEAQVRDQIVLAMRLAMDISFLRGTGSVPNDGISDGNEPLGVLNTSGVTTADLSNAAPGIADLKTAVAKLEDNDVPMSPNWGWISHPRTFRTFEYMTDDAGVPVFRDTWSDEARALLVGHPVFKTTQIPITEGTGSDESELYFGDWGLTAVGLGMDVEMLVSADRYIEYDQTFLMAVAYVDFLVLYPKAFHVHTGVGG